jgi:hypothetical protein
MNNQEYSAYCYSQLVQLFSNTHNGQVKKSLIDDDSDFSTFQLTSDLKSQLVKKTFSVLC